MVAARYSGQPGLFPFSSPSTVEKVGIATPTGPAQATFDANEFLFANIATNGVYWDWTYGIAAEGYESFTGSAQSTPGTWANAAVFLTPKAIAPPPPPELPEPSTGGIPGAPGGPPVTSPFEGIQNFFKSLEETTKTLVILGVIVAAVVILVLFTPRSPSPAQQAQRRVQVRRVRVGEVGVDPATRQIGVKDVEVAAR